jgi:transcriptional regulator with XRE-family HTH domain
VTRYRIRELREATGLSRADLANRLGLKAATLGLIEDGYFEPRAVHILALASILGVKPEELLAKGGVPAQR